MLMRKLTLKVCFEDMHIIRSTEAACKGWRVYKAAQMNQFLHTLSQDDQQTLGEVKHAQTSHKPHSGSSLKCWMEPQAAPQTNAKGL